MPRIIPRLIQKIAEQSDRAKFSVPLALKNNRAKKSLYQPLRPKPSYYPGDYEQSILLKPGNPVSEKKAYVRHKTQPPRPYADGQHRPKPGDIDPVRLMNDSECNWWANPYCTCLLQVKCGRLTVGISVRMLTSPLRKCTVTGRYLPTGKHR
jgi:hypothetical protein